MMTTSNGDLFQITGPLCGDFTGHWWIPLTKASDSKNVGRFHENFISKVIMHLLFMKCAEWPKLHEMFKAHDAKNMATVEFEP